MELGLALVQFEAYDAEANRFLGLTTITLPEIEFETTDIKGSGILGTVSWPVRGNLNNLTMTYQWLTITAEGAKILNQSRGYNMSLRGLQDGYDAGTGERKNIPVRIDVRSHATKLSLGKFEVGEQTETELEVMLDYIKVTIGGAEVLLIDKFNYVYSINGEDISEDIKAALGRT